MDVVETSDWAFLARHPIFQDLVCSAENLLTIFRSMPHAFKVKPHIFLERLIEIKDIDSLCALHRLVTNEDKNVYPKSLREIGLKAFKVYFFKMSIEKALTGEEPTKRH